MIERIVTRQTDLRETLEALAWRQFLSRALSGTAWGWGLLTVILALAVGIGWLSVIPWPLAVASVLLAYSVVVAIACWLAWRGWLSIHAVARSLERVVPEVDSRLLTAIEQIPDPQTGRFSLLQEQVINEAAALSEGDWTELFVPTWRLRVPGLVVAICLLLTVTVLSTQRANARSRPVATLPSSTNIESAKSPVTVEPGDVDVERGSSVLVVARFSDDVPGQATLVTEVGTNVARVPMDRALDDPLFGTRLTTVRESLVYRVVYDDDEETRSYQIRVYDLPALVRGDLVVQLPSYTGQPERRLANAFRATVVEQSRVVLECRVNKSLTSAVLRDKEGGEIALEQNRDDPLLWSVALTPEKSTEWKLHLTDGDQRTNRDPETFRIDVVPNQPPKMELAFPGKDVRVSPLEELTIEGRIGDDFGLQEFGIALGVAGQPEKLIPLGQEVQGSAPQSVRLMQAMEDLQVAVDDLVSFHLYAVDLDRDGKPRRVNGDLFFAEVRPFDETYRQMDSPPGGASSAGSSPQGSGNQIDNLLQVQKQIVSATWNLSRETSAAAASSGSDRPADKLKVLQESQAGNREKLSQLLVHLPGAKRQRAALQALDHMRAAENQMLDAATTLDPASLEKVLPEVQSAYKHLLNLKAREHLITQGQQSGGGSGAAASASQQELNELELSSRENRYESRSQAGQEPNAAAQEELATLDRLKELARRQGDLSQKLKELEAALRLADTPAEQEEIERQLRRLRDEQQQLLEDADELRERVAQSTNQENFREVRDQLEQTRQRMVDATEALQEGQLSQALSSTSRAERELNETREQFREQTSARFAEAMRSLREQAREIGQRQEQLRDQLADKPKESTRPSLRSDESQDASTAEWNAQREQVAQLLNNARQVVQDSEAAEPLLSQQLYETLRQTRDDQLESALEVLPQLVERGFLPEARKAEEQASRGLERLVKGIDRASEAVLGSELESLKRARREVAELSQELQNELQRQQMSAAGGESPNGAEPDPKGAIAPAGEQPVSNPKGTARQPGQGPAEQGQEGSAAAAEGASGQTPSGQKPSPSGSGQQRGGDGAGQEGSRPSPDGQGQGRGAGQQGMGEQGQAGQGPAGQGPSGQGSGSGEGAGEGSPMPQAGNNPASRSSLRSSRGSSSSSQDGGASSGPGGQAGPFSGSNYRDWAERLRDVESMVADPDLQAEVSKLREQARSLRAESTRHSQAPNWELVKTSVYEPLVELQRRLGEEVAKRESNDSLVPIDRDPVPARYRDLVRTYYQRLGEGTPRATSP